MTIIVAAAIRGVSENDETLQSRVYSLPAPARHGHVARKFAIIGEEGFVASDGHFYTRVQSLGIAMSAKQLKPGRFNVALRSGKLYSEDIW